MGKKVLITGGAGFVGSHLADELLRHGHSVRAFDNLSPQVHGSIRSRPDYLDPSVELVVGDVRDRDAVVSALDDVDVVFHLAAMVGVGQSMYQVDQYVEANTFGTAVLMQALLEKSVERLVVASSMSIYGEGLYRTEGGHLVAGVERPIEQLKARDWEVKDRSGATLTPVPTPESKTPTLPSVYALTKYDQERLCLGIGRAYNIPTVALRFFNIYGTRQALSNPYTGVLAIFASRVLNGNPPLINEDGNQRRDFVSVHDIVRGCRLAMESDAAVGHALNIGTGRGRTILEIAGRVCDLLGRPDLQAEITGKYRMGDIRHCFADITNARTLLGYEPEVDLDAGLAELASWLQGQVAVDRVADASAELAARGLTV